MSKLSLSLAGGILAMLALALVFMRINPDWVGLVLAVLFILWGIWFVHSFVLNPLPTAGTGRESAVREMFAFAYTAPFLAILIMALPFSSLLTDGVFPRIGSIHVIRGCVVLPAATEDKGQNQAVPAAAPGGGQAAASDDRSIDWPIGSPVCGGDDTEVDTILITLGGAIGKQQVTKAGKETGYFKVSGGYVIPMYIVDLALLGAIINIVRRLPEYQKRTHADFVATDSETPLQPYETRDFVVFQLLQLLSAPLLAMVAFYALAPHSLAAAVGIAFGAGLFSEALLLRIRAVIEGPDETPTAAAPQATTGAVRVVASAAAGGAPVPQAQVVLTRASAKQALGSGLTDQNGVINFKDVLAGDVHVEVTSSAPDAHSASADGNVVAGQLLTLQVQL